RVMPGGFRNVRDADRRAVLQFLDAEASEGVGATDLDGALSNAIDLLAAAPSAPRVATERGPDAAPFVLYLGDAIPTQGAVTLDALRARLDGRATFVGVAVGDPVDAEVLRGLADASGGLSATLNPGEDLAWRVFDLI